jgi:hypothetical protein
VEVIMANKLLGHIQELDKWIQSGANILTPSVTITFDSESPFVPVISTLVLSPNPKDKEVYPSKGTSGKFALHGRAYSKIGVVGNVQWRSDASGPIIDPSGDRVRYQAVGGIVTADGGTHYEYAYANEDLDVRRDDLEHQYAGKVKTDKWAKDFPLDKQQNWINTRVERDFRQKRVNALKSCETNAQSRVVKKLFDIKPEYSAQELKKPFVIVRFTLKIDYSDPDVKLMLIQASIANTLQLFGPGQQSMQPMLPGPQHQLVEPDLRPIDASGDPNLADDEPPTGSQPPPADDNEPTPEEVFLGHDRDTKIKTIKALAKRKGHDLSTLDPPVDSFNDDQLMRSFIKLNAQPDVEIQPGNGGQPPAGDDDIPDYGEMPH